MAGRIFRHAGIAGAVAKGQDRLFADFLGDHGDLVHLEILDDKFTAEDQLVIIIKNIVQTVHISLIFGDQGLIGTDDLPVGDMQRGIINDAANDETVGTADNVYGKVIGLQIVHDLQHGLVPAAPSGHAVIAGHGEFLELLDIAVELCRGHTGEGRGDAFSVVDFQAGEGFAGFILGDDLLGCFLFEIRSLVDIIGIFQDTVDQQRIVEIIGICFTEQGTIQIKNSDPVLYGNEIRAAFIRDRFHIGNQCLFRGRVLCPQREHFRAGDGRLIRYCGCLFRLSLGSIRLLLCFDRFLLRFSGSRRGLLPGTGSALSASACRVQETDNRQQADRYNGDGTPDIAGIVLLFHFIVLLCKFYSSYPRSVWKNFFFLESVSFFKSVGTGFSSAYLL